MGIRRGNKRLDRRVKAKRLRQILKNTYEAIGSKIMGRRFNRLSWGSGAERRLLARNKDETDGE